MAFIGDVPGLNKVLRIEDLEKSQKLYNRLPDDSQQPKVQESHILNFAELFVRNGAHKFFCAHLVHGHFKIPEDAVLLGVNYDTPRCRWAKTTAIQTIDLSNVHGHIFVLTDHGFHPYEYQTGPVAEFPGLRTFLREFSDYLEANKLAMLVGLEVIDPYLEESSDEEEVHMSELILPASTIMSDASNLKGCVPSRQTAWKFKVENGEPRVCTPYETHAQSSKGHEPFNAGAAPILDTFRDVLLALQRERIFSLSEAM